MKKVILINIPFYTYNQEIIDSLKEKGFDVDFFSYKPTTTSIQKFRFKYSKHYRDKRIKELINDISNKTKGEDIACYIFINPTTFTGEDVKAIMKGHENAKKVLYLWDAVKTYPQVKDIFNCFDKIYSFDIVDCKENGFIYRPTFASKELLKDKQIANDQKYDIFYVASYSKDRYFKLRKMIDICEKNNLKIFYHLYIRNKLAYLFFKLQNLKLKKKYVSTKLLSNDEKMKILSNSKAIFDTPLETQTGLTMRVIEGMILGKKIITTNTHIKDFDFYNSDDFIIFDNSFDFDKLYSECSYKVDKKYYTAQSLVEDLLK